jgi:hypothetical protein
MRTTTLTQKQVIRIAGPIRIESVKALEAMGFIVMLVSFK